MKKIIKYILEVVDNQIVDIPLPATILSVTEQGPHIALYAIADDDKYVPTEPIDFLIKETGHPITDDIDHYTFIGTVKLFNSNLEFHVFFRHIFITTGTAFNIVDRHEATIKQ